MEKVSSPRMTNLSRSLSRFRRDPLLAGHIPGGGGGKKNQNKNNPKRKKKQPQNPETNEELEKLEASTRNFSCFFFFPPELLLTPYGFSLPDFAEGCLLQSCAMFFSKPGFSQRAAAARRSRVRLLFVTTRGGRAGIFSLQLSAPFGSVCRGV